MRDLFERSNRYEFIEDLKEIKSVYYLVCIDIINFKHINDIFGFSQGDKLLYEIIRYIYSLNNKSIKLKICRYERDIIIVKAESDKEKNIIEMINNIISYKYSNDIKFRAGYKRIENNIKRERFLECILNVIKNNKYVVDKCFDEKFDLSVDIEKYCVIKHDILSNDSNKFYLVYQPKINVKNQKVESCEVLSRWNHHELGNSNPHEFLSIIRELEKEIEFDLMIFEKVYSEIVDLKDVITNFSINISMKTISKYRIVEDLDLIRQKYNIDTNKITLEILEDICDENTVNITRNIQKLTELGYSISIDDFGTGYSSYFRLSSINFSEVKIPREFLRLEKQKDIMTDKSVLNGIVNLCKQLNYKIVIEGVETEEDLKLSKQLNIDYIQGYYYSKPVDKINYRKFIRSYNSKLMNLYKTI